MLIMDTHALLWSRRRPSPMSPSSIEAIDTALQADNLAVSAFTFWEVAMLLAKERLDFPENTATWRRELLEEGLIEIPVDGDIGIRANALPDFHADPADRIIVATALSGHRLVTADERILAWGGRLDRLDARH